MAISVAGCQQENEPLQTPTPLPEQQPQQDPNTYSNSKYGFSFGICKGEDIEVVENYHGTLVALLGAYLKDFEHRVGIGVIATEVSANTILEDILEESMKEAENTQANFAITEEDTTTIAGVSAKLITFTYTMLISDIEYTFKDVLAIFMKDNTIYAIKYNVPEQLHDQYLDCFNLVLSTFKLH